MGKKHVFNAGPCLLPQVAIDNTIEALKDFKGTGVSLISISHRTKGWDEVMDECRALWKEILGIPEGYEVVFLGGGASLEFLYVAMNYLEHKAGYLDTGVWAKKALKEAKGIGDAFAVASSADKNYSYIPKGYEIPGDLDYFHITTNNTIYGTEIREDIDCPVPLIADMSSDILSRRVDVSKYTLIYGGCASGLIVLMLFNLQISADLDTLVRVLMIAVLLYLLMLVVILYTVHKMASKRYKLANRKIETYRKWYDELENLYKKEEASTAPSPENVAIATDKFEAE